MRLAFQVLIVCIVLAAMNGCESKTPTNAEAKTRVEAAMQINNPSERDQALAKACRDAAKAGAVDLVAKGASNIGNPSLRDEVVVDCVLTLRDVGQGPAAIGMTKLIGNPSMRDGVLKKLAGGS